MRKKKRRKYGKNYGKRRIIRKHSSYINKQKNKRFFVTTRRWIKCLNSIQQRRNTMTKWTIQHSTKGRRGQGEEEWNGHSFICEQLIHFFLYLFIFIISIHFKFYIIFITFIHFKFYHPRVDLMWAQWPTTPLTFLFSFFTYDRPTAKINNLTLTPCSWIWKC